MRMPIKIISAVLLVYSMWDALVEMTFALRRGEDRYTVTRRYFTGVTLYHAFVVAVCLAHVEALAVALIAYAVFDELVAAYRLLYQYGQTLSVTYTTARWLWIVAIDLAVAAQCVLVLTATR